MSCFPHIAAWKIGEAILIIQAPTHHTAAVASNLSKGSLASFIGSLDVGKDGYIMVQLL
jgi:hypothetical protein